jgi:peptidoglycan biosynthesis protein MviN/MurJ (putative lipid II flippase)
MSIAAVRPDSWNFPLLLHVLGAMVLVALLAVAAVVLSAALRSDDRAGALRLAFRTLLIGAIPAYLVMRVGAEWVASKENLEDADFAWINIGYSVADGGLLVLIVMTVLTGIASRRAKRGDTPSGLVRWANGLALLLIVAYAVALWAMAAKPT